MNAATRTSQARRDVTVYDVFTPTTSATLSAVPRSQLRERIGSALVVPGRQLFIYGRTGSGKSTALYAELRHRGIGNYLVMRCTATTTLRSMISAATRRFGIPDGGDDAILLQQSAIELARHGIPVVVEDAHRMAPAERARLLDAMKVVSDLGSSYPGARVIVIAAVESPELFAPVSPELATRIAEISVHSMSTAELRAIVQNGGEWMNVDTSEVEQLIASRSGGSASITHQLALTAFERAGVTEFVRGRRRLEPSTVESVFADCVLSMPQALRSRIDAALSARDRTARAAVLNAMAGYPPAGVDIEELIRAVRSPQVKLIGPHFPDVIADLASEAGGRVIQFVDSTRVRFSEPRLHSYWTMIANDDSTAD